MSIKIYKISSTAGEKVYVGSTSQSLDKRWVDHKASSNDTNSRFLFEKYGVDTCVIELLEEVKDDERTVRERWWIENTENVVNQMIPGRTDKEYREANKELRSHKQKERYQENKEIICKKMREYYEANKEIICKKTKEYGSAPTPCPKCGKIMRRDSIRKHLKVMHL